MEAHTHTPDPTPNSCGEAKHPADNLSLTVAPEVITYGSPCPVILDLHCTLIHAH